MDPDLRDLLRAGAGVTRPSFTTTDVAKRGRSLRRRRLMMISAGGTALVLLVSVVAGRVGWRFQSDRPTPSSTDGSRADSLLVYSSAGDIFALAEGGEPVNLTGSPERELNPAVSPDGSTVIFERIEGPDSAMKWGLHSVSVDGGGSVRLTSGERETGYDLTPAWSPDGDRVVFVRHLSTGTEILGTDSALVVMARDGSGEQELTQRPGVVSQPSWSLDGETIFFGTESDGEPWVAQLDINSGEQSLLVRGSNPQVLTSDQVAFVRTVRPFVNDVFSVSLRTERERRLTQGRDLRDLVAFGAAGLAAAEGGELPGGGGERGSPTRIVFIRSSDGVTPKAPPIHELEGFSLFSPVSPTRTTDLRRGATRSLRDLAAAIEAAGLCCEEFISVESDDSEIASPEGDGVFGYSGHPAAVADASATCLLKNAPELRGQPLASWLRVFNDEAHLDELPPADALDPPGSYPEQALVYGDTWEVLVVPHHLGDEVAAALDGTMHGDP